jgi:hypothetical protein
MSGYALLAFFGTWILYIVLCVPFLHALKKDAPDVYVSLGSPSIAAFIMKQQILLPLRNFVLSRTYAQQLSAGTRAKAWASWLFAVYWLYLGSLGWLVLTMFNRATHDF